jgi:hypothetical protein
MLLLRRFGVMQFGENPKSLISPVFGVCDADSKNDDPLKG